MLISMAKVSVPVTDGLTSTLWMEEVTFPKENSCLWQRLSFYIELSLIIHKSFKTHR